VQRGKHALGHYAVRSVVIHHRLRVPLYLAGMKFSIGYFAKPRAPGIMPALLAAYTGDFDTADDARKAALPTPTILKLTLSILSPSAHTGTETIATKFSKCFRGPAERHGKGQG
jgi:hypothetical protein